MASSAPAIDVDRAVLLNARYGSELHWRSYYDRIVVLLGFTNFSPDARAFAEALAAWQRTQGLEADGVLGPTTWERLQQTLSPQPVATPFAPSADFAGWSPPEINALRLTTTFENGRPLEFGGLTGDFDGCGCSFGLLQWNIGSESLQPLLAEFARERLDRFTDVFGADAAAVTAVLQMKKQPQEDSCTSKPVNVLQTTHPALAWAKSINDYSRRTPAIVGSWAEHFRRLAGDPAFRAIEARWARRVIDRAEGNARDLGLKTERGLALMVDCVTQNGMGWLDHRRRRGEVSRRELIAQRRQEVESNLGRQVAEPQFMEIIAKVVASTLGRPEWAADVLQRRLIIASGSGLRGGRNFDLARDFNLRDAPWEQSASALAQPAPAGLVSATVTRFVQLANSGPGFYTYSERDRQYGRPDAIDALTRVGAAWLRSNPAAPRMGIGDISFQHGGEMPPHRSHRDGSDADIRPIRSDNLEEAVSYLQEGVYSRALTQALVNTIRSASPVNVARILFNDPGVEGVRRWEGHDNHLHVHFGDSG
jgi:penicillin-insensitive murein endopeptidase/putative peptidoglycan binding protein